MNTLVKTLVIGLAVVSGAVDCDTLAAETPPLVMGFERLLHTPAGAGTEAGEVLLSELSCLACHRDDSKLPPALAWKSGPNLGAVGDRLRAEYIREFLANPAATKPGTTMPSLIAAQPEAQRAELADDLTHFLMQLRGSQDTAAATKGTAETGRELYHSAGCVACHSSVPLVRLGEKYAPGQLAHFLRNPLEVRPAGRMPDFHLSAQEAADLAAFIAPEPPASKGQFVGDPAKAQRGAQAFQSLGCISCHGGGANRKPLVALDPNAGCLTENPTPGIPRYPLSKDQRTAIRVALQKRKEPLVAGNPNAEAYRLMLQRHCFACHVRDGIGGPGAEIAEHFTSTRDDLGDQGRIPPQLDGVGRKLQQPVIAELLRGQNLVRKYMRVRMPDFGPELAEHLSELLARADADPNEVPTIGKVNPNQVGRNEAGREVVGTKGFSCISCHDLHGHASLGIGAYDLAEMPKRLRPEWMRDFLLNPAAFPTGARMPAFWPADKSGKKKATAERQIDSVRVYLSEADQSLPPEGFIDHAAYELKPTERPIIFRTFIDGVGTHAVAVGFPQGVNVAFDSLQTRWSLAWRGRFLNADGTWHQRDSKLEKPLGDALVHLENTGALAIVGSGETKRGYRGYRVGADGVPTFLYDLGALHVEDRFAPGTVNGLRRSLRVSGQTNEAVEFSAQPPAGVTVRVAGQSEFPVPLKFQQGTAEIVEEISW
jgi:mono/diheme cytochrome c family protein